MKLKGSQILVQTLIEQGVTDVFGYPGGQVINIYDALYKYKDEINHILTAHEQGAAHAAERQAFRSAVSKCIRTLAQRLCRGEDASKADVSPLPSMAELPVSLRTLCATVGGAAGAVCHCVQGGFSYYDLYGALLLLLLTPVGCALFCFALDVPRSKASSLRPLLGQAALLCAVCFCLRSVFFLYFRNKTEKIFYFTLFVVENCSLVHN